MSFRTNRYYLILLSITLFSGWLVKLTGLDEIAPIATSAHSPDYFAKEYSKWRLNTQGQLSDQLFAVSVTHYNNGTTHLNQPELLTFPVTPIKVRPKKSPANLTKTSKSTPWFIKAEQGILSANGKELQLNNKVFVNRVNTEQSKALTINTRNLHVALDSHQAETKEWVELLSPPQRTTAVGMKLIFIEPIMVRLLARVQGHYEIH